MVLSYVEASTNLAPMFILTLAQLDTCTMLSIGKSVLHEVVKTLQYSSSTEVTTENIWMAKVEYFSLSLASMGQLGPTSMAWNPA